MNTLDLKDKIATMTLSEGETKLLCVMAQYWIEELPDYSPLARKLSEQLRELACRYDIH